MSIINDALKRAQKNLEKNGKDTKMKEPEKISELTKDNRPRTHSAPLPPHMRETPEKKKMWYETPPGLFFVFLLIVAILITAAYYVRKYVPLTGVTGDKIKRNYMPKKVHKTYKPGEVVLSGTSLVNGNRLALINDGIYEPGDMVEGYQVIKVETSRVELQTLKGDTLILKISSPE
ncbi:MAG: hypothetical protein KBD53_01225 [Candidatus Omnitrophica bacterium]|nr:hypothetical protein [Candidatus Omnitrophota bacterium]